MVFALLTEVAGAAKLRTVTNWQSMGAYVFHMVGGRGARRQVVQSQLKLEAYVKPTGVAASAKRLIASSLRSLTVCAVIMEVGKGAVNEDVAGWRRMLGVASALSITSAWAE